MGSSAIAFSHTLASGPVTVFPGEIYQAPLSRAERAYPTIIYFHEVDKGGHFAAWEELELYANKLRAPFRSRRWGEDRGDRQDGGMASVGPTRRAS